MLGGINLNNFGANNLARQRAADLQALNLLRMGGQIYNNYGNLAHALLGELFSQEVVHKIETTSSFIKFLGGLATSLGVTFYNKIVEGSQAAIQEFGKSLGKGVVGLLDDYDVDVKNEVLDLRANMTDALNATNSTAEAEFQKQKKLVKPPSFSSTPGSRPVSGDTEQLAALRTRLAVFKLYQDMQIGKKQYRRLAEEMTPPMGTEDKSRALVVYDPKHPSYAGYDKSTNTELRYTWDANTQSYSKSNPVLDSRHAAKRRYTYTKVPNKKYVTKFK